MPPNNQNRKAIEWLEKEYSKESTAIAFFIAGGYLSRDKVVAEEEFRLAVESLKEKEDNDMKKWAETVISTNFRCLQTTETIAYWSALLIDNSSKEGFVSMDKMKFKITTASDYVKRSAPANTSPPRKRITITDDDGILLDGLNASLFSHLKTIAINKLHSFENQSEKEQYYTTMAMNNVLDLSNQCDNDQINSLSSQQVEALNSRFGREEPPQHYVDSVKDSIGHVRNNIKHALKFISSRINDADVDDLGVLKIYREVLENHLQTPEVFDERRDYSELDYMLYFWGPLIKDLFVKTDVWSHWGDTESEECRYKFRMDLRFLCRSLSNSPDHGSGEFARKLTASKYYSDKKKLVLNGIIQLDNILSNYKEDPKDVKIPLFQALGYSADLYCIYRVNPCLYILNHIGTLKYPISKKNVTTKTTELIEMLLKLKNMVKVLEENVSESNQSAKQTVESVIHRPSQAKNNSPKRSVWLTP